MLRRIVRNSGAKALGATSRSSNAICLQGWSVAAEMAQTRPSRDVREMSVLPSISAVMSQSRDGSFVP